MGTSIRISLLGAAFFTILLVAGCGDDTPQSPQLIGEPPAFLTGVWEVTDTSTVCYPFGFRLEEDVFTDTICLGGLDFGTPNAQAVWDMYLQYEGIIPGRWTELTFESCSGIISDTLINVYCVARASATLEECDFTVRFYTRGRPNGDQWTLLRSLERIEGEDCGRRPGDSIIYCRSYVSDLRRIADEPQECHSSNTAIGR